MPQLLSHTGHVTVGGVDIAYLVIRSPRRKRSVEFRVDAKQGLVFRVPVRTSIAHVEKLIHRHLPWIQRQLVRRSASQLPDLAAQYVEGGQIPYRDTHLKLKVAITDGKPHATLHGKTLTVHVPRATSAHIRTTVEGWFRQHAVTIFPQRVAWWAARMNLTYGRVHISNPKRQWASCSYRNDLRFSWRLLMVPPPLLDYVIVHELAHVVQKNHSPAFWAVVAATMPDYQQRRQALNALGGGILP